MRPHTYSIKEFSLNPSRVIQRALRREELVVITLRGVPAVRLVPVEEEPAHPSVFDLWAAMPDVTLAREAMTPLPQRLVMRGEGPSASDMLLEDRR